MTEESVDVDITPDKLRLGKYMQLCDDQSEKIEYLNRQLQKARTNPLRAIKDRIAFSFLKVVSSKSSPLPKDMKRRFARSARKRDPRRNDLLAMMENVDDHVLARETIRGRLGLVETVLVVAPKSDLDVANMIIEALADTRLSLRVVQDIPDSPEEDLCIVIKPMRFERLPPAEKLIIIAEGLERDMMPSYRRNEVGSFECLCMAGPTRELVNAFYEAGWPFEQIYYVPLGEGLDIHQGNSFAGSKFHVLRMLHGLGVLSIDEICLACKNMRLPSARVVLSLPEHKERYDLACRNHMDNGFIFHGLRNIEGWKGCASSYKFLCAQGLDQKKVPLLICEDDAEFVADFEDRLIEIEQFLSNSEVEWDVFSGLLTDLDADVKISQIIPLNGGELIEVDQFIGAVFTIYNRRAMRLVADYNADAQFRGGQRIDRYLGDRSLRVMTAWPPLVDHDVSVKSSISRSGNMGSSNMIKSSLAVMERKREVYLRRMPSRSL